MVAPTGRRGRPRLHPITEAKPAQSFATVAAEAVAEIQADAPRPVMRPDARRSVRDAAARAAEIMEGIQDMDMVDDFYFDPSLIPDGWSYEWKTKTIYNKEDPAYEAQLARGGWEPVPAERHPELLPPKSRETVINRRGLVLMERPKSVTDHVNQRNQRNARDQVRDNDAKLTQAEPGTFDRNNKDQPMVKMKKSLSPFEIPSE